MNTDNVCTFIYCVVWFCHAFESFLEIMMQHLKNEGQFCYRIKHILRKGEIVSFEQIIHFQSIYIFNSFPHKTIMQQTTLNILCQNMENLYNWMDNLWLKVENIVAKGEIVLSNFFFWHHVFKKLSAAEASKSVYMRERVKAISVFEAVSTSTFTIGFNQMTKLIFTPTISLLLLKQNPMLWVLKRIASLIQIIMSTHNIGLECNIRILDHYECPLI